MKLVFRENSENYKAQRNQAFFQQLFFRKVFKKEDKKEVGIDVRIGINILLIKNKELFVRVYSMLMGTGLDVDFITGCNYVSLLGGKPKFPRPLYRTKLTLVYYLKMLFKNSNISKILNYVDKALREKEVGKFYKNIGSVNYYELAIEFLPFADLKNGVVFINSIEKALRVRSIVPNTVKIIVILTSLKNIKFSGPYNFIRIYNDFSVNTSFVYEEKKPLNLPSVNRTPVVDIRYEVNPEIKKNGHGLYKIKINVSFEEEIQIDNLGFLVSINGMLHNQYVQSHVKVLRGSRTITFNFNNLGFKEGVYTCFCSLALGDKIKKKMKIPMFIRTSDSAEYESPPPYYVNAGKID